MQPTVEQLKTLANAHLSTARTALEKALDARRQIVEIVPHYRGPSIGHLSDAIASAYRARTFADTPYDLPEASNPHR